MRKTIYHIIVLVFVFLFNSCSNPEKEYEKAKTINTVEAYQSFIKDYPNSDYAKYANDKINELSFENAKKINTEEAYQKFIKEFPDSKFNSAALDSASKIAYVKIKNEYNRISFERYLKSYPTSMYSKEINEYLENIKKGRYIVKEDTFFSNEKLKKMFNWNGSMDGYITNGYDGIEVEAESRSYGNIEFINVKLELKPNGFLVRKGTIIKYKPE